MSGGTWASRVAGRWEADGASPPALLTALARVYAHMVETRERLYARGWLVSRRVPAAVVAVGNLTVGGTGKTPAVELTVRTLQEFGARPAVLSRGYRRRSRGVQIVADHERIHLGVRDAGDEPSLLARRLPGVPIVVGSSRYEAAEMAIRRFGAGALVVDDGFQHRTLAKDVEIVTVPARNPWGNARVLPAGPLREPLTALQRADLIVATCGAAGDDVSEVTSVAARYAPDVPLLVARLVPEHVRLAGSAALDVPGLVSGKHLVAFAGIGRPDGFTRTIEALGVKVAAFETFPDHHWYVPSDLARLSSVVEARRAEGLVTTEKDAIRLESLTASCPLYVLGVRLVLCGADDVWRATLRRCLP